ncbi:MAG: helix-turn-helix domain-containing protein [Eggerthellaceae bacterium]|nr:helix-turn-helix domain-containing protein [Eggerthellaceae bacterium]
MAIRNSKEFGQAIKDRRKKLGYTQTELAEACDVGVMFVSHLEGGKPTAQLEKAIRVANRVGLDLDLRERG